MATFASIPTLSDYLVNGYWGGAGHHWSDNSISVNISDLTAAEKTVAQTALSLWHDVCNINFTITTGPADITCNNNGSGVASTSSLWDGDGMISATVGISSDWAGGASTGNYSYFFQTYLHEIGHALGLGHQGPYNNSATYGVDNIYTNDTWQWSVMSYFEQDNFGGASFDYVLTPQMADIYAAISMYGAQATRAGDTTYGFNSTAGSFYNFGTYAGTPAFTLYDTGGIDRLDASGYTVNQTIDLRAGGWSSVGGYTYNIGIYLTSVIENALGGAGNDTLIGNGAANALFGNAGNDSLFYNGGLDFFNGGAGTDTADCSQFSSAVWVDLTATAREIWTRYAPDTLSGVWSEIVDTASVENVVGTAYADLLRGDAAANTLWGGAGNDLLMGRGGNDVIDGGTGTDTVSFATALGSSWYAFQIVGSDVLVTNGTEGTDTVRSNVELYQFGTQTLTRAQLISAITPPTFTEGADTVALPLLGGTFNALGGDDRLSYTGGFVTINGGAGADTVNFAGFSSAVWVNLAASGQEIWTQDRADLSGGTWRALGDLSSVENVVGSSFSDTIYGDGAANRFGYTGGYDTINGGAGTDTINFSQFSSAVWVDLTVVGSEAWTRGTTNLTTGTWREIADIANVENVVGSNHADILRGNAGANSLEGGSGADTLTGGGGSDTFVFKIPAGGVDVVTDFAIGPDSVQVSALGFGGGLVAGATPSLTSVSDYASVSTPVGVGSFILDNYGANAGTLYWDANGGSGADALAFVQLQGVTSLLPSDIHVV